MNSFPVNTRAATFSIFAAALVYLLVGSTYGINIYDEGIMLTGAQRVASGELPYRDFWTMYAPGQFYLLAGLFKTFGFSLLAERILSVFIMLGSAISVFYISRKSGSYYSALLSAASLVLFTAYISYYGKSVPTALLFSVLALLLLHNFYRNRSWTAIFCSGIFSGLVVLFRHDLGGYLLSVIVISVVLFALCSRQNTQKGGKLTLLLNGISGFLLGAAIVLVPAVLYLAFNVPHDKLWNCLIKAPGTVFPEYRSLPLPIPFVVRQYRNEPVTTSMIIKSGWEGIVFYVPALIFIISIFFLVKGKNRMERHVFWTIFTLVATGSVFYLQSFVRSDLEHVFPSFIISTILIAFIFSCIKNWKGRLLVMAVILFILSFPLVKKIEAAKNTFNITNSFRFPDGRAKGIAVPKKWGENYYKLLNYLEDNLSPGSRIYIGNIDHDRIMINDAGLYFLSGLIPGTYYHDLHPGIVNDIGHVKKPIIDDLKKNHVIYVVLLREERIYEPNRSVNTTDYNNTDSYIQDNYSLLKEYGDYVVKIMLLRYGSI